MQLSKKLKSFLIFLVLVSYVPASFAQNVVKVEEGQPVPFNAWCLTELAMAKIIADKEQEESRCQLRLDKLSEEMTARYNLDVGTLTARIESMEKEHKQVLLLKDEEIEKLEKIALDKPNNYWYLFTAGGFVVGVGVTVGIVYVLSL